MWLFTLCSCPTISFGCLVSTGCFTQWWTSPLSYSALRTESSMLTGGTLRTLDDSGRIGTSLSIAGLLGKSVSVSLSLSLSLNFLPCRHVYNPLIKSGYNKIAAQLIVFAMSAFFHEVHVNYWWALSHVTVTWYYVALLLQYLVSVPLHMLRPWAFVAMLGQVSKVGDFCLNFADTINKFHFAMFYHSIKCAPCTQPLLFVCLSPSPHRCPLVLSHLFLCSEVRLGTWSCGRASS